VDESRASEITWLAREEKERLFGTQQGLLSLWVKFQQPKHALGSNLARRT
jgi:hypothetical protein